MRAAGSATARLGRGRGLPRGASEEAALRESLRRAETSLPGSQARLQLIYSIATRITAGLSAAEVIQGTLRQVHEFFPAFRVAYSTIDVAGCRVVAQSIEPDGMPPLAGAVSDFTAAPEYLSAVRQGRPLIVEDVASESRLGLLADAIAASGARARLDVPLQHCDLLLGVLCLDSPKACRWGEVEVSTLEAVGRCLSVALHNARAEEALRVSEARGRAILHALDALFRISRDGTYLNFEETAGLTPLAPSSVFLGKRMTDVLPPAVATRAMELLWRTLETGEIQTLEYRLAKDGTALDYEARLAALGPEEALITVRDVTERKRTQEELQRQKEILQTIFDYIPVMVGFYDAKGNVQMVNREVERVLGWPLEDWQQGDILSRCFPDPSDRQEAVRHLRASPSGWRDFRVKTRTGATVEASWANVRLSDGSSIGIAQNITERKRLEEQLRQSQKMEAIGLLAGGIAHDFNNLLTVINGYSDLLLATLGEQDPARLELEEIHKAGQRAASLIAQLMAFSRSQVLEPEVLDLNSVVGDMDSLIRPVIGENVALVLALEPALGRVRADRGQIEQVILNLSINARDAMPRGGELRILTANQNQDRCCAERPAGSYVVLTVADTGVGMDDATRARIFEPFFTTKGPGRGTGLGLATVYGIVRQSGGCIEVSGAPGEGASFRIYLPRTDEEPAERPVRRRSSPRGRETVLLVEDEDGVRALARQVLVERGYTVLEAGQPQEALRLSALHAGAIHLLLTDLVMPQINGRELAEHLTQARANMKVLYMSGYAPGLISGLSERHRMEGFVSKPFTPQSLASKVREALDASGPF